MDSFKPFISYLKRYVGVVVLGVTTLVGAITILNYIWPAYQETTALRSELDNLRKERDELTTYIAYLNQLASSDLPLEEELVNYALPSENDVISLIVTYEGLSKTEGVEVSPFDFAPGLIQRKKPGSDEVGLADTGPDVVETGAGESSQSRELEFKMEAKTEKAETAIDFISKIHQARRVFTIKSLTWKNPTKDDLTEKNIVLQLDLGTYYYPIAPTVEGSAQLVNKGKTQGDFIAKLNQSTVYDSLVLDAVEVGKDDFFTYGSAKAKPVQEVMPTPEPIEGATPSAEVTSLPISL